MENNVFRLRLELRDPRGMRVCSPEDLALAGAERGIIRDVLVPSDMRLRELHHLIQRLFGWGDLHLHRFALRGPDFNWVTEGKAQRLSELSGVLFRIADETGFEWRRHLGPDEERRFDMEESYLLNRARAGRGLRGFRAYPEASGVESVRMGFNILLDRLRLGELLTVRDKGVEVAERSRWKARMQENVAACARHLEDLRRTGPREYQAALSALRAYQSLKDDYLSLLALRASPASSGAGALDALIAEHEERLGECAGQASILTRKLNPPVVPMFGGIYYWYDRGDEWCVSVSCTDKSAGSVAAPVCIHRDGADVMDNVGGVSGYFKMLRALADSQREEAGALREMALIYGWQKGGVVV